MAERFFHTSDSVIFHGVPNNPNGFSFGEARALANDDEKLKRLKIRLDGYYINGLKDISHPFISSIMVCVGLEVLGQVIFGFNSEGFSIDTNTIKVYELLDSKISLPLSPDFKTNYNLKRNKLGENIDFCDHFNTYAHVIRKGLRNTFTHNYRSLGVYLGDSGIDLIFVDEINGHIIINPKLFMNKYIEIYENSFSAIFSNNIPDYRNNALKYFDLLIK